MSNNKSNSKKEIKRLYLSEKDKKIAGVCGGLAGYFEVDSSLIRLAWIILTVITGIFPGLLAYLVAAIVIPNEPSSGG